MNRNHIKALVLLAVMALAFFAGRSTSGDAAAEAGEAKGERGEKHAASAPGRNTPPPGPPRARTGTLRTPVAVASATAPTPPPNPPPPLHASLLFSDFNVLTLEAIEALQLTVPEQLKVNELYRDLKVAMGAEASKHVEDVSDQPDAAPLGQYVIKPFPKEGAALLEDFATKITEALGSERGAQLSAAFREGKRFADAGQNRVEVKITSIEGDPPPSSNSVGISYLEVDPTGKEQRSGAGPLSCLREPYGLDLKVQ